VLRVFKSDFERAWEMEREAVERETRDARARRAAARRRRRAERRARRCRRRQKRTLSATSHAFPTPTRVPPGSESESDSEDDLARTTVDPERLEVVHPRDVARSPDARLALSELSGELSKKRDVSNRTAENTVGKTIVASLGTRVPRVVVDDGHVRPRRFHSPVAPQCDDETTGDPLRDATEDAYFGFVLAGELIVSSSRGVGVEKKKKSGRDNRGANLFTPSPRARRATVASRDTA